MNIRPLTRACLSVSCAFFLGSCATEPSLYTGKKSYYGYSWEQELELGSQADSDIVRQMGLYQDDEVAAYVRELGQEILQHSAFRQVGAPEMYRDTEFTFRVLDSPVVNAFALPGGFVYITRGLLSHVENEAQLAVVIGHEITHVEARHASQQALKQQWGQVGLMAGAIIGQQIADNEQVARQIMDVGGSLFQVLTLKYGRDAERESDEHGVEYAAKAGYAASEGSEFFRSLKRLSERSGQSIPSWMSSHPDPGEREETIKRLAAQWREEKNLEMDTVGRELYLDKIEGLVVGENPRNGYTEDGQFYHPDMRFQFSVPSGWNVRNDPAAVYIVEPNGNAMLALSVAKEETPLAAAQAAQQRLKLQTSYSQPERINGLEAYVLEGGVQTESGTIPVYTTFISHQDQVFTFLGYGSPEAFAANKGSIRQSIGSFQELTNQKALNIQPYRIEVRTADRSAPFQEFLPSELPGGLDPLEWAIMNQVELDERIERGRMLKLPASR